MGFGLDFVEVLYPARTLPPFTFRISPVMWRASGDAKNRMGPAISAGDATLPNGIPDSIAAFPPPEKGSTHICVSTHPGATELTRISGASSVDHDFVTAIMAPLLAAYGLYRASPR